jgi:hypothetical protein
MLSRRGFLIGAGSLLTAAFVKDAEAFVGRTRRPLLASPPQVAETMCWYENGGAGLPADHRPVDLLPSAANLASSSSARVSGTTQSPKSRPSRKSTGSTQGITTTTSTGFSGRPASVSESRRLSGIKTAWARSRGKAFSGLKLERNPCWPSVFQLRLIRREE